MLVVSSSQTLKTIVFPQEVYHITKSVHRQTISAALRGDSCTFQEKGNTNILYSTSKHYQCGNARLFHGDTYCGPQKLTKTSKNLHKNHFSFFTPVMVNKYSLFHGDTYIVDHKNSQKPQKNSTKTISVSSHQ